MIKLVAERLNISYEEAYELMKKLIETGDPKALPNFLRSI